MLTKHVATLEFHLCPDSLCLLLESLIDNLEELVGEVQENQGRSLHQLDADHVAILSGRHSSQIVLIVDLVSIHSVALAVAASTPTDALSSAWLFEDLDVEAKEFADEIILYHFLVIQQRLLV